MPFLCSSFVHQNMHTAYTWESFLSCQLEEDHRGHVLPKIHRRIVKFTRALYFTAHSTIRLQFTFFSNTQSVKQK